MNASRNLIRTRFQSNIRCCIENIFLAATAENYGYTLRIPLGNEQEYVKSVLNFPDEYIMPCYIGIGKIAEDAVYPEQKAYVLDDRIHMNGWK